MVFPKTRHMNKIQLNIMLGVWKTAHFSLHIILVTTLCVYKAPCLGALADDVEVTDKMRMHVMQNKI